MCGIALIISGIRINLSSLLLNHTSPLHLLPKQPLFSIEDIKTALRRRGPDSLGTRDVIIYSRNYGIESLIKDGDDVSNQKSDCDVSGSGGGVDLLCGSLQFIGATLQLRGAEPVIQPLIDASGNVLVYNGEIYEGIDVDDNNDTEILMEHLGQCCTCTSHECGRIKYSCQEAQSSIPELLSKIKGPWAFIYWQASSRILWFGRDAFGRRSLLVHWPTEDDPRLLLSSVSPLPSINETSDHRDVDTMAELEYWDELPCGVYSVHIRDGIEGELVGEVTKHQWADPSLLELIRWERCAVEPKPAEKCISDRKLSSLEKSVNSMEYLSDPVITSFIKEPLLLPSQRLLIALKDSVKRRAMLSSISKATVSHGIKDKGAPVAVLFSGGLDSMIIAALLHQCVDAKYEIDLLNVSFDGSHAPDRISAVAGLNELGKIAPSRRWNLVEIDSDLPSLTTETKHVMSLLNPAKTYMDLNIGLALWLAAKGEGRVYGREGNMSANGCDHTYYKSNARILLVGSGADEQCAGYGRHKTKYKHASWIGLHEEMKLDMQRIWKRNLGRDDRCIADSGKEARFPFLDENVIGTLLDMPLWEIANLDQPSGVGDKKILREVGRMLGLSGAAGLPKRAIQFGTRIARESNKKNFGSNRAANQASAGSVVIFGPSK